MPEPIAFSDEEIVLLQELDLDLGDIAPPRRLVSMLWWTALGLGGVAMAVTLMHAGLVLSASHIPR
ncbi:MAG TPA: hypothetical protein VIT01_06140 [Acidimicrobiales bacterium]